MKIFETEAEAYAAIPSLSSEITRIMMAVDEIYDLLEPRVESVWTGMFDKARNTVADGLCYADEGLEKLQSFIDSFSAREPRKPK
jgi:hypothetical protein